MTVLAVAAAIACGVVFGVVAVLVGDRPMLVQLLTAVPVGLLVWQATVRLEHGPTLASICIGMGLVVTYAYRHRRRRRAPPPPGNVRAPTPSDP